jgi:WD40 repeat protein
VITGGWDAGLSVWDVATRRLIRKMEGHSSLVMSLAMAPDRRTLASTSADGTIRLWDLNTGRERSRIRAGAGRHVRSVSFAPDGRQLATVSDTGTLRFWDVEAGEVAQEAKTLRGHTAHIICAAFSPDEERVITGSRDGTARIWRTATGELLAVLQHPGIVHSARFSPDGSLVVTADDTSGKISLWDAKTGLPVRSIDQPARISTPVFSPDGATVFGISAESVIVRWKASTWEVDETADTGLPLGVAAAISPDGSTLVTANSSGTVRFFATTTLRERTPPAPQAHMDLVSSTRFSPDGKLMATASFDGSVRLWDWRAGTVTAVLKGHQGWIGSVAFTPDGRRLVTGGQDGTITFWNLADQQELVSFKRHPEFVSGLVFSRDGQVLVSVGGPVGRIWRAGGK